MSPVTPDSNRPCPRCGQLIPAGQKDCPVCSVAHGFSWSLEQETLVLGSFILLSVLFMITGFATKRYHATQAALGGQWYQKGEAALKANQSSKAVDAFHTALVYARDNRIYQLRLAEALISDRRMAEAESYLGSLWVQEPGNGTVNLELARLAANKPEVADAVRYYQNAIFGLWDSDPILHRRETRIELCEFLLAQGEKTQAESELIALQTDLPEDAALHAHIAAMFMQVDDYRHALEEFQHALKLNPRQAGAWTGAGEALFQMSRYADARHYLERAVAENPEDTNAAAKLAVVGPATEAS